MKINKEKLSNVFWVIVAIAVMVAVAYSFLTNPVEHIEDRNGENNTAIAVITDKEIIDQKMGSKGLKLTKSKILIAGIDFGGVKFHSKKFTGVEPLLQQNILFSTGFTLSIYNYNIESGNFRLYVLNEDKIIDVLEPSEETSYFYENIKGEFTVVAVGESANFKFEMTTSDYNEYYHFGYE